MAVGRLDVDADPGWPVPDRPAAFVVQARAINMRAQSQSDRLRLGQTSERRVIRTKPRVGSDARARLRGVRKSGSLFPRSASGSFHRRRGTVADALAGVPAVGIAVPVEAGLDADLNATSTSLVVDVVVIAVNVNINVVNVTFNVNFASVNVGPGAPSLPGVADGDLTRPLPALWPGARAGGLEGHLDAVPMLVSGAGIRFRLGFEPNRG
jgi:hypothetical protein